MAIVLRDFPNIKAPLFNMGWFLFHDPCTVHPTKKNNGQSQRLRSPGFTELSGVFAEDFVGKHQDGRLKKLEGTCTKTPEIVIQ